MELPFSAACERNREPILAVLREHFADRARVLEIGSGTGQHAVHLAAALTQLIWQTSDVAANLPGIEVWLAEARLPNTPPPLLVDVDRDWPCGQWDAAYSANTLHIMSWEQDQRFFAGLGSVLAPDATLAIYGPFRYGGNFTSPSNEEFDRSLRDSAAHMGIRDIEAVLSLANEHGFKLSQDIGMPANNQMLIFKREAR